MGVVLLMRRREMPSNTEFDQLPDAALIRQKQMLAPKGPVPYSAATVWRRVKDGTFPQPIRIPDSRITCWKVGEVRAWLAAQGGGA